LKDYQIWEIDFLKHFRFGLLKSAQANQSAATPNDWLALFVACGARGATKSKLCRPPVAVIGGYKSKRPPTGNATAFAAGFPLGGRGATS